MQLAAKKLLSFHAACWVATHSCPQAHPKVPAYNWEEVACFLGLVYLYSSNIHIYIYIYTYAVSKERGPQTKRKPRPEFQANWQVASCPSCRLPNYKRASGKLRTTDMTPSSLQAAKCDKLSTTEQQIRKWQWVRFRNKPARDKAARDPPKNHLRMQNSKTPNP